MRTPAILATLALLLAAPLALAQNETGGGDEDTTIVMDPPDNVDVDITENNGDGEVEESVAGWGTTGILVAVIVGVLVIALIVAAMGRDRA